LIFGHGEHRLGKGSKPDVGSTNQEFPMKKSLQNDQLAMIN
jgi:hypothetical protein